MKAVFIEGCDQSCCTCKGNSCVMLLQINETMDIRKYPEIVIYAGWLFSIFFNSTLTYAGTQALKAMLSNYFFSFC